MKIIVSIVLLFSCIFIADGSRRSDEFIYIDRPGSSLRFFKRPGVSGAVSFDFQKNVYSVWRHTEYGSYIPLRINHATARYNITLTEDSIIRIQNISASQPMVFGLNDGSDSQLKVQLFGEMQDSDFTIELNCSNYNSDASQLYLGIYNHLLKKENIIYPTYISAPAGWTLENEGIASIVADSLDVSVWRPDTLSIWTSVANIKVDLNNQDANHICKYFPIYKYQDRPLNKIIIFLDKDFGTTTATYRIKNNKLYLINRDKSIELEEIIPGTDNGYPCFIMPR